MSINKKNNHTVEKLQTASQHLKYHIGSYVDTLRWLSEDHIESILGGSPVRNAVIVANLVHARILIEFLNQDKKYPSDIRAADYVYINNSGYPLKDKFLKGYMDDIGGRLVHLTTKSAAPVESDEEWGISEIADNLFPALSKFLDVVQTDKLADGVKSLCETALTDAVLLKIPGSLQATT